MKFAPVFLLALLVLACSSPAPRPVFSDFMEVREIKGDDPLAARFVTKDREEYRLGDPVVSGKSINRMQVKRVSDGQFDLHLTLTGADDARWRRFARSRGRQAALVVDGTICCVFDVQDPGPAKENELLVIPITNVAQSQEEADRLDQFLEQGKAARKKKVEN
jgi:hypothetical protein